MFDFEVLRGVNRVKGKIHLNTVGTMPGTAACRDDGVGAPDAACTNGYVLGRWVSQWEQYIIAIGCVSSPPGVTCNLAYLLRPHLPRRPTNKFFLNRIWTGLVSLEAGPVKMFTGGNINHQSLVQGYDLENGDGCYWAEAAAHRCARGAVITGVNPFPRGWALKEISYDVYLEEAIEYDATFKINAAGVPVPAVNIQCAKADTLARVRQLPGMWAPYPNHDPRVTGGPSSGFAVDGYTWGQELEQRLADDVIPLPLGGNQAQSLTGDGHTDSGAYTFFMIAEGFPGRAEVVNTGSHGTKPCLQVFDSMPQLENLVSFDCCLTTAMSAAACRAEARGLKHFNLINKGNATMVVDGLELIVYPVVKLPMSYTAEILNFNALQGHPISGVAEAGFTCADVTLK